MPETLEPNFEEERKFSDPLPAGEVKQPELDDAYDVVVVGGGPAGATVAALLADFGHAVLLLERSGQHRFHVGESLIPETYWTLKRLGLIEQLKQSAFPKKYSVQFINEHNKESAPFYFDKYNPHESSQTWQVVRAEFDQMMLENARQQGATVHCAAQVRDLVLDGGRCAGVRVKVAGEEAPRDIRARVVVDATGQSAFIASRLKLKSMEPHLKMGSVWSYFRGAQRDPGKDEGATLIIQTPGKKSWFWYIPLPDDVVSVGVTGSMSYMLAQNRGTAEEIFAQEMGRSPAIQQRLAASQRCDDFHTTRDYSYSSRQGAGDGWVLVGDAFGFIDPVYSSGVFLALKSGEMAADAIHAAIEQNDLGGRRLGCWQEEFRGGVESFRKLVYAFYSAEFSFAKFLKAHPEFRDHLVDILIGDVFKPGLDEMFAAMGDVLPQTCTVSES